MICDMKKQLSVLFVSLLACSSCTNSSTARKSHFSFDLVKYELQDGYTKEDLEGRPWINSNIDGEIDKIKKPSLKEDFYASINYERLVNRDLGPMDEASQLVSDTLYDIRHGQVETSNGDYYIGVANKVGEGAVDVVRNILENIDVESYLNSKEMFSTYLNLVALSDGYEIEFKDGYTDSSDLGYQSIVMFSDYTSIKNKLKPTANSVFSGFGVEMSDEQINAMIDLENELETKSYEGVYYNYTKYLDYIVAELPWEPMKNSLIELGLSLGDKITICKGYQDVLNTLYAEDINQESLKYSMMTRIGFDNRFMLGFESYRSLNNYLTSLCYSTGGYLFYEEINLSDASDGALKRSLASLICPVLMEQSYIEILGSEKRKQITIDLIDDILKGYIEYADEISWISDKTRKGIKAKLENMRSAACYLDQYKDFPELKDDDLEVTSLYELSMRYKNQVSSLIVEGKFSTYTLFDGMPSYEVNAFYSPLSNSFVILDGITLAASTDSIEELYGMLGTVIGHEISHAFDSTGSQFDEHGNQHNWWDFGDYARFNRRINNLVTFYDNFQVLNGYYVDGNNVNGEVTADMGGVKIMLELAKKIDDFDYDLFFRSYAYLWYEQPMTGYSIQAMLRDEHPFPYMRVNATLAQFDEFIETYNLKPGDGMYIPKDERVAIW